MIEEQTFDFLIIGGGQAGIPLAQDLAKAGHRVALAERKNLGGSCVNFGCTPTKAVIASARVAFQARRGAVFGLRIPTVEVDFPAVLTRARSILMQSRASLRRGFETDGQPAADLGARDAPGPDGRRLPRAGRRRDASSPDRWCSTRERGRSLPDVEGLEKVDYLEAAQLARPARPSRARHLHRRRIHRARDGPVLPAHGKPGDGRGSGARDPGPRGSRTSSLLLQRLSGGRGPTVSPRLEGHACRDEGAGSPSSSETRGHVEAIRGSHVFVATGRKPNTDDLGLRTSASRSARTESSRRTSGSRRASRGSGQPATFGAGRCSPTRPGTTFVSFDRS